MSRSLAFESHDAYGFAIIELLRSRPNGVRFHNILGLRLDLAQCFGAGVRAERVREALVRLLWRRLIRIALIASLLDRTIVLEVTPRGIEANTAWLALLRRVVPRRA